MNLADAKMPSLKDKIKENPLSVTLPKEKKVRVRKPAKKAATKSKAKDKGRTKAVKSNKAKK